MQRPRPRTTRRFCECVRVDTASSEIFRFHIRNVRRESFDKWINTASVRVTHSDISRLLSLVRVRICPIPSSVTKLHPAITRSLSGRLANNRIPLSVSLGISDRSRSRRGIRDRFPNPSPVSKRHWDKSRDVKLRVRIYRNDSSVRYLQSRKLKRVRLAVWLK